MVVKGAVSVSQVALEASADALLSAARLDLVWCWECPGRCRLSLCYGKSSLGELRSALEIESQNQRDWKRHLRSASPTTHLPP